MRDKNSVDNITDIFYRNLGYSLKRIIKVIEYIREPSAANEGREEKASYKVLENEERID